MAHIFTIAHFIPETSEMLHSTLVSPPGVLGTMVSPMAFSTSTHQLAKPLG